MVDNASVPAPEVVLDPTPSPEPIPRPLDLLLVEPDPEEARRIAGALREVAAVRRVTSLEEAAPLLRERGPDLILVELRASRDREAGPPRIPLANLDSLRHPWVALTAPGDEAAANAALAAGAIDYLLMSDATIADLPHLVERARREWLLSAEFRVAQEKLRRSEAFHRSLVDSASDAIFTASPDGRYADVNRAACELLGYAREELIGLRVADTTLPEDLPSVEANLERMRRGERVIRVRSMRRKDGSTVRVEISGSLLPDGHLLGVGRDITERERVERELRDSEERFRGLIERFPIPLVVHSAGTIDFVNTATVRVMGGGTPESFLGKPLLDLFHPDSRPDADTRIARLHETAHPVGVIREMFLRRDGVTIDVELMGTAITYRGRPASQLVFRDVSAEVREEKERERLAAQLRQAQRLETIGTLAGGIAHDFNNIIQAVLGFAEMAKADVPPRSRTSGDLDNIILAARRAKHLVEQILMFSRLDDRERRLVDLRPIVLESLELLRATIPKTLEIRHDLVDRECRVFADPTQVQQVVMNLGTNSFQAMREKGTCIEVVLDLVAETEERVEGGGGKEPDHGTTAREGEAMTWVRLRVRDDGPGMPDSVRDRIFEPFFTTKDIGEGTGLGLSVVHGIASSHGARISVDAEPGVGTTFEILWPAAGSEPGTLEVEPEQSFTPGKGRILVVDDEPAIARMIRRALARMGYDVVETTKSPEALAAFRSHPDLFDLVLTDQTMPHLTGVDLIAKIREVRPDIPVILMTGYSETVGPERAAELGVGGFLMKPVTSGELGEAIARVLSRARLKG